MNDFLLTTAVFILIVVGLGLVRMFRGPTDIDRIMAAQNLGTGCIAVLLLLQAATDISGAGDVALILALVGILTVIAFARSSTKSDPTDRK